MQILRHPDRSLWNDIIARPRLDATALQHTVQTVLHAVETEGDTAVLRYEEQFDHVRLASLLVPEEVVAHAPSLLSPSLWQALQEAHQHIADFHRAQLPQTVHVTTATGVDCWQRAVPLERVGLYVPGGSAPLFSTVLMLATPARLAGCNEVVLCTPPQRDGSVHPAILAAAHLAGVHRVVRAGGVQAIAAMAYGTESVPQVHKIFGPGNQWVMAAKQTVSQSHVAIDMPAGPSEVCVVADHTAQADLVAADLLSQAEHGPDSQALLLTTSEALLQQVQQAVEQQMAALPRAALAAQAMEHSRLVLLSSLEEAMELANAYAPEHLILATENPEDWAKVVRHAGSVFMGHWACESAGDYASGTNHTLPTHGWATAYSGVNMDSFMRKITFQQLTPQGVKAIGPAVVTMAEAEGLQAHAEAMRLRLQRVEQQEGRTQS